MSVPFAFVLRWRAAISNSRLAEYLKVNAQPTHAVVAPAMVIGVSLIARIVGDNPWVTGYAFAMAWFYSRALQEHTDQDADRVPGWRDVLISHWDAWRASKFLWAFVPATALLLWFSL